MFLPMLAIIIIRVSLIADLVAITEYG